MGFWLALSHLTLDDLKGSKVKVILFDMKYVKNGKSYDVGPSGDYIECPWASVLHFGCPWEVKGQGHNLLIRNILKTVTDTMLERREDFFENSHGLSIDTLIGWLWGVKTKVTVFDVKYVENGKSYDVGPNGGYVDSSTLDLCWKSLALLLLLLLWFFSPLVV